MNALRRLWSRLQGWRGKDQRDADWNAEFQSLLAMHVDDNVRAGMNADEAKRQAILRLGAMEPLKENLRDMSTLVWIETAWKDLRYALRGLHKNPGFSFAAILSLALGIGVSSAIFTVADCLLLRPLPYPAANRLMMLWESNESRGTTANVVSPADYLDWKRESKSFESMAAFQEGPSLLSIPGRSDLISKQNVSLELLPMLGAQPIRGRLFLPEEAKLSVDTAIIISYRLWQSWFGGEESVIGKKVQVNATPRTIVGVMPPDFYFRNREVDLWQPLTLNPAENYRKSSGRWMLALARLKPGVSRQTAQSEMTAIAAQLETAYPEFNKNWGVNVEPLQDSLVREVKSSLLVLLAAVGLLLAVACANVANLQLARYTARRREFTLRASLGAGRWRVIRQLLTESLCLSVFGGVLGVAFAYWAVSGLIALAPKQLSRIANVNVDWRIVMFTLLLSALTSIIFGLAPAISASKSRLAASLREDTRAAIGSGLSLRNWLVGGEIALAVILLAGAGLLFRSFVRLQSVESGLDPHNVLTFRIFLPAIQFPQPAARTRYYQNLLEHVRQTPGVASASAINTLPFAGQPSGTWTNIEGRPPAKPGEELGAVIRSIMPEYFRTMGIPMVKGRDFTLADNAESAPHRFIVNEAFVRKYLAGEEPIGVRINALMSDVNPFGEIIGVTRDLKEGSLDKQPAPTIYYPHVHLGPGAMVFVLRAKVDPTSLIEPLRQTIHGINPEQSLSTVRLMEEVLGDTMSRERFSALLLSAFSLAALLLAAIGIYGVLAYSVNERTREIGVRIALGANPITIVGMVVKSGARVIFLGTTAGIAGALALSTYLKTLLFSVGPRDPMTFVTVPATLILIALLAAYLPARRAARVDPAVALRAD